MNYDICCIGHITLDKIVTDKATVHMPGGTSYYFSHALAGRHLRYLLVTALAESEMQAVNDLRAKGIEVKPLPSAFSVFFENVYSHNQDHRTQRVLQTAAPFTVGQLQEVEATIYHLGPLLADDIPGAVIKSLAAKGKVSLDVQGFLRRVAQQQVLAIDWAGKKDLLPCIHFLKASEHEAEVLTGHADVHLAAKALQQWGAKEIIITMGSKGSLIYYEGAFYTVPAYHPLTITDATGCGDTYMAGYLYQRLKGGCPQQAGAFAAAMATLKIETSGPFTGTDEEVAAVMKNRERTTAF